MEARKYIDISELNKKPTILTDLDDVLSNLVPAWVSLYNAKYNDNLYYQNIKTWEISKYVKPEVGDKIFDLLKEPGFIQSVPPKEGAIKATQILSKYYEIYILTACVYPENILEKFKWVDRWFPHIGVERIITAKNKGLFYADYMIDDYINNLNASKCKEKILFTAPHNALEELPEDIIRIPSWNDILWWFAMQNDELMNELVQIEAEKEPEQETRSEEHVDNISLFFLLKNIFNF